MARTHFRRDLRQTSPRPQPRARYRPAREQAIGNRASEMRSNPQPQVARSSEVATVLGTLYDKAVNIAGPARVTTWCFGAPASKLQVVPNAVEQSDWQVVTQGERFEARTAFGLGSRTPVVAIVGALAREQALSVQAVSQINDAQLLTVGVDPRIGPSDRWLEHISTDAFRSRPPCLTSGGLTRRPTCCSVRTEAKACPRSSSRPAASRPCHQHVGQRPSRDDRVGIHGRDLPSGRSRETHRCGAGSCRTRVPPSNGANERERTLRRFDLSRPSPITGQPR
jgi:hypothetical protein